MLFLKIELCYCQAFTQVFIQEQTTIFNAKGVREPQEYTILSSRWLLSELVGRLQHHMVYTCKVRKYGTLLYRPSSDIVMLLTEAMWKLRNTEQAEGEKEVEEQADCTTAHSTNQLDASNINKLLHLQIQTFVAEDGQVPYEHDNLNINALIQKNAPKSMGSNMPVDKIKTRE